jgi:hypothetical protein
MKAEGCFSRRWTGCTQIFAIPANGFLFTMKSLKEHEEQGYRRFDCSGTASVLQAFASRRARRDRREMNY